MKPCPAPLRSLTPGASAAMAPAQLLKLADTLAGRQAGGDGSGYSAEALLLHVEVLRAQERFSEAADLAAGAGAKAIPLPADRRALHASLLVSRAFVHDAGI